MSKFKYQSRESSGQKKKKQWGKNREGFKRPCSPMEQKTVQTASVFFRPVGQ